AFRDLARLDADRSVLVGAVVSGMDDEARAERAGRTAADGRSDDRPPRPRVAKARADPPGRSAEAHALTPRHASRRLATRRLASPCVASPRVASPRLAPRRLESALGLSTELRDRGGELLRRLFEANRDALPSDALDDGVAVGDARARRRARARA